MSRRSTPSHPTSSWCSAATRRRTRPTATRTSPTRSRCSRRASRPRRRSSACASARSCSRRRSAPTCAGARARRSAGSSVEPTEAGAASPVRHFAGVPTVQWHGDTFDLPEGVERLATSRPVREPGVRQGRLAARGAVPPRGRRRDPRGLAARVGRRAARVRAEPRTAARGARVVRAARAGGIRCPARRVPRGARGAPRVGTAVEQRRRSVSRPSIRARVAPTRPARGGAAGRRRTRAAGERMPRPRRPGTPRRGG